MERKEGFLDLGKGPLYYRRISVQPDRPGPVLFFLHDALGSVETWKAFPERLCRMLQLDGLIYDRLGHGRSGPDPEPRPLDYLEREAAEVLPRVLEKLGVKDKILVGHSDGGTIALLYEAGFNTSRAVVSLAAHYMVEERTRAGVENTAPGLLDKPQLSKLKRYHGDKAIKLVNDWSTVWLSEGFKSWNVSPQLRKIKSDVLVIQGREDEYATDQHAISLADIIGKETMIKLIDGCGHFPHKEKGEEVIELIVTYLNKKVWRS